MANVERSGTVLGIEAIRRHFSPEQLLQHPSFAIDPFERPPRPGQPSHHQGPDPAPPRRLQSPPSPWMLTAFPDFSDIQLSSPFSRPSAPQPAGHSLPQPPAFPPSLPTLNSRVTSLSPAASHFFLHATESIFSSPSLHDFATHNQRSSRNPDQPIFTFASDPPSPVTRLAPFMPQRPPPSDPARRLERLLSSGVPGTPSPRPRSSRRRGSSPASSPTLNRRVPDRGADARPAPAKREERPGETTTPGNAAAAATAMPVTTRKRSAGGAGSSQRPQQPDPEPAQRRATKRARISPQRAAQQQQQQPVSIDSDIFDEPDPSSDRGAGYGGRRLKEEDDGLEIIDLMDPENLPVPPPKPRSENEIRLGSLQCSICMDDMKDLTATHCGHLFCGACLHGALHANPNKTVCPICRQKIDVRPNGSLHPKSATRGFWPLSLKLMTATRKGKRKAGDAS